MNKQTDPTTTSRLIVKFLRDELSVQEQAEFDRWLSADPNNKHLVESFRDTESVQKEINYIDAVDGDAGWAAVSSRIHPKTVSKSIWRPWLRYAAAAALFLSTSIGTYYAFKVPNQPRLAQAVPARQDVMPGQVRAMLQKADGSSLDLKGRTLEMDGKGESDINRDGDLALHVPKAGEYKMTLPDGTKVWLNAASTLKFPASFNQTERRVQLDGEAYFEVAPDKKHPFIVSFNDTQVEVLGTHFNIETYGASSKTTLVEGSIKITEGENQQMVEPGQQALVQGGQLRVQETDIQKSVAWKEGLFYFKEDRIDDILDQISRWYDVEIVYTSKPNNKRYDGTIRRQATLSQVLDMLNTVSGTEFTINNRTVTVNFK